MAAEYGVEYAARKLNHSSTKVTRDHYIVLTIKSLKERMIMAEAILPSSRKPSKTMPVLLWQKNEKLIGESCKILTKNLV